jgi:LemA protein
MMEIIFVVVVVIAIIIVVKWYISTQRELVNLDEKCKNALSQIEVQLNSRWDALLALAKAAQSYAKQEGEVLVNTIAARRTTEVKTAADVNAQQDAYTEMLSRLMVVNEAYPELKASGLYEKTMENIKGYEENVRMARMIYNDTATRMNRYVRQWPSSFVASQQRFEVKEYLKIDNKEKKDMPTLFAE